MKPREREFCRLMLVYADPIRAAREIGFKHPESAWQSLLGREDIAEEIRRLSRNIRSVYESTAVCGLYKLAFGGVADALSLLYDRDMTKEELSKLDLSCVSEIKRTDKGVEIKFCDRTKAMAQLLQQLDRDEGNASSSGLLDAMMLSAEALGRLGEGQVDNDAV